ncbi:DUF4404 family protein [Chitinivibrio alkaliphilus]|uniref:DUF4404 domain-containing protein n=1 Tax=Chitinivibrio alkaliphilus ACht1 TaxID=1313304 RepID=U7DAY9_9BACT|nr:DUF4404 family protein [Chitinivibrio alkaliphilus]ERP31570.1 hypothetical protein CALK_1433 [Chitinivibrio alkaliphilus ACht1]
MEQLRTDLRRVKDRITDMEEQEATELLENIDVLLEHPGELSFKHHRMIAESLKRALERFEYAHPRIIDELRTIITSLNEAGI